MKIMVLGAAGMLGHKVTQILSESGHDVLPIMRSEQDRHRLQAVFGFKNSDEAIASSSILMRLYDAEAIDVRDTHKLALVVGSFKPDAVINCLGIIKQRPEAEDAENTTFINSHFPHLLAKWAASVSARLIHISTDCVFDGTLDPLVSYPLTYPITATDLYGRSKSLGEIGNQSHVVTLRTSIVGRELSGHLGLLDWLYSQQKKTVSGYTNHFFSGVSTLELAHIIDKILSEKPTLHGLFQVASEPISKYKLLLTLRDALNIDVHVEPKEVHPFCNRTLDSSLFDKLMEHKRPHWSKLAHAMSVDPTPYPKVPAR